MELLSSFIGHGYIIAARFEVALILYLIPIRFNKHMYVLPF